MYEQVDLSGVCTHAWRVEQIAVWQTDLANADGDHDECPNDALPPHLAGVVIIKNLHGLHKHDTDAGVREATVHRSRAVVGTRHQKGASNRVAGHK